MDDETGFLAYWFAYRSSQARRRGGPEPTPRRYPSMPKRQWRLWALACITIGALLGTAVFGLAGWAGWRGAVIGGLVGLVGGMLFVETRWVRRQQPQASS